MEISRFIVVRIQLPPISSNVLLNDPFGRSAGLLLVVS